jgi:hypothetical protein
MKKIIFSIIFVLGFALSCQAGINEDVGDICIKYKTLAENFIEAKEAGISEKEMSDYITQMGSKLKGDPMDVTKNTLLIIKAVYDASLTADQVNSIPQVVYDSCMQPLASN